MKKTVVLLVSALILYLPSLAQQAKLESQMLVAIELHEQARTFEDELKAAQEIQKISNANPNDWLAAYWAAFIYSQVGNLSQQDKLKYLDMAFQYYERTERNAAEIILSDEEKSNIMALKGLLCSLYQGPYFMKGDAKKGMEFVNRQLESINKGLNYNPENPLLFVLMGTSSIGQGFRSKPQPDLSKLLIGKVLLLQAKEYYKKSDLSSKLIPNRWNEAWIDFWLKRVNDYN